MIALTKIYDLNDARIASIQVKGDLIIPPSDGRIMTRSRAKLHPDRYTAVPANLKILKVLIDELQFASGSKQELDAAVLEQLDEAEAGSDDEWEDDPTLALGLGTSKAGKFLEPIL